MKKNNASSFGHNFYFICPIKNCGHRLSGEGSYRTCENQNCKMPFHTKKISCTCSYPDCEQITAALCLAQNGEWESRCQEHLDETAVKVGKKIKHKAVPKGKCSEKNIKIAKAQRSRGERIIHKGEFPGQHIGYH